MSVESPSQMTRGAPGEGIARAALIITRSTQAAFPRGAARESKRDALKPAAPLTIPRPPKAASRRGAARESKRAQLKHAAPIRARAQTVPIVPSRRTSEPEIDELCRAGREQRDRHH